MIGPNGHAGNDLPIPFEPNPTCHSLLAKDGEEMRQVGLTPSWPKDKVSASINNGLVTINGMSFDFGVDGIREVLKALVVASTKLLESGAPLKDFSRVDVLLAKAEVKLERGIVQYKLPEKYDSRFVEVKSGVTSTEMYLKHLSAGQIVVAENITHRFHAHYLIYKIPILTLQAVAPSVWKGVMNAAEKLLSIATSRKLPIAARLSALELGDQLIQALNYYGFGVAARQSGVYPLPGTALQSSKLLDVLDKIDSLEQPIASPTSGILNRLRSLLPLKQQDKQIEASKQSFDLVFVDLRLLVAILFDRDDIGPKKGDTMYLREVRYKEDVFRLFNLGSSELHLAIHGAMVSAWIKFQIPELEKLSAPPEGGSALEEWLSTLESRYGLSVPIRIMPRKLANDLMPIYRELYEAQLNGLKGAEFDVTGGSLGVILEGENKMRAGKMHVFEKLMIEKDILLDAIFKNFADGIPFVSDEISTEAEILRKYGLQSKDSATVKTFFRKLIIQTHPDSSTAGQDQVQKDKLADVLRDYERLKTLGFFK